MLDSTIFFIKQGGITSALIVIIGVAMVLFALERIYYLFLSSSSVSDQTLAQLKSLVYDRRYTQVIQVCNEYRNVLELRVIKAGVLAAESGREAMKSALGGSIVDVGNRVEKYISYMALIASSATLLGLLGTISGLIKTFSAMSMADASQKAALLGQGIAEAMYSTGAGLTIGLVAMAAHTIFSAKADSIKASCKKAGFELMAWIEKAERITRDV